MFRTCLLLSIVAAAFLGQTPLKGLAQKEGCRYTCTHCFLSDAEATFLSGAPTPSPLCGGCDAHVYLEPPADFDSIAEVSGCFCEYQGKMLYLLRNPEKPQGNTWCVPGGKLNKGETPSQAAVREVNEETGIQLEESALVYCHQVYVRFPERDLILHIFRYDLTDMPERLDIAQTEHSSYRWVTFEEALAMPLIPGGSDCLRVAFSEQN